MITPPADNYRWAWRIVDTLSACGVRRLVASPGSRSTPLTLAALRHPRMTTRILLDERTAAFFALGQVLADGTPCALVATSGSAPAHWLPAVIEAFHAKAPLVLLSADRPEELHGCGANQTTPQTHLFSDHVRGAYAVPHPSDDGTITARLEALIAEAAERAQWPTPGPVHLNLPFREPLTPAPVPRLEAGDERPPNPPPTVMPAAGEINHLARCLKQGQGLIVVGPHRFPGTFATAVTALAAHLAAPVFADPLSNLRWGDHHRDHILCRYDAWLREPAAAAALTPDWILRFGAAPVSRSLLGLLETTDAVQWQITPYPERPDPTHRVARWLHGDPATLCRSLVDHPQLATRTPAAWAPPLFELEESLNATPSTTLPGEAQVIHALLEQLPADSLLFSGNSMSIRDIDGFSGQRAAAMRLVANRGISGIDGNIATLLGLAASRPAACVGVIGDLALWHDASALLAADGLDGVLVVLNNGGGGIFGYLPQSELPEFAEGWLTPVERDIADLAQLHGLHYAKTTATGFPQHLATALKQSGFSLIEVEIQRESSIKAHRQYWRQVARSWAERQPRLPGER